MSDVPLYSNELCKTKSIEKNELVPQIISQENVENLNKIISFAPHGIIVFTQYKEKPFIVNGFSEQLFWDNVLGLYSLIHDCGLSTIRFFLNPRVEDGRECLNIFGSNEGIDNNKFAETSTFINEIEILRHLKAHNFKPDSNVDQQNLERCRKWFKKICKEEYPSNQNNWKSCNKYIVKVANEIYEILNIRLEYLMKNTTDLKEQLLLEAYYDSCKKNFSTLIFKAFNDVCKKNRLGINEIQAKARLELLKDKLIKRAIETIKNADRVVDPYKVLVETITLEIIKR